MTTDPAFVSQSLGGRILVVDDNRDNAEIIVTRLRYRGYDVDDAATGERALERIHENPPDVVLLDLMLPDIDGYEVAARIRADETLPFIPIIMLTARDLDEDQAGWFEAGADEYLTKPVRFPELESRVRALIRIKRLHDELEIKNAELERLSTSDGLTGLFNHRHIHELLREEFERSGRTGAPITVAMFDLDHFKTVNDTWGHLAGDIVLREIAALLRRTAREVDRLGRYGGEEFIAILPSTDPDGGAFFVERVRRAVEAHTFEVDDDTRIRITVSAGTASTPRAGIHDAITLVRCADEALYTAKRAGRNRCVRYGDARGGAEESSP
jgi:two-component system cell cycle response regulator